jgi:N-acetyl-beta-hexosaminidase
MHKQIERLKSKTIDQCKKFVKKKGKKIKIFSDKLLKKNKKQDMLESVTENYDVLQWTSAVAVEL